ncbi:MAG: DUF3795 domain-containing protein [Planctomycetota bacterium]|jgi:hypothetical protein
MNEILGRCGYRCDLCPAYKDNIDSSEDRQRVSDGWFKYYGFRIPPAEIYCDGCRDEKVNAKRIDAECKVRQCAITRGVDTCANCEQYLCDELKAKVVSRSSVEAKTGAHVPDEDYKRFVEPYEADKVLSRIRESNNQ